MAIQVKKREGESNSALIYRFTKRIRQGGVIKEAKRHQRHHRTINRNKRRVSALYREEKKKEIIRLKKLGLL